MSENGNGKAGRPKGSNHVGHKQALEFVRAGGHPYFASALFGPKEPAIRVWMKAEGIKATKLTGSVKTDTRNARMLTLRNQELTMEEIAAEVGCTRANVSLILTKHGMTGIVVSKSHKAALAAKRNARLFEAQIIFLEMRGQKKLYREIKDEIGQDAYNWVMKLLKEGDADLYDTIRTEQLSEGSKRAWEDPDTRESIIKGRYERDHYGKAGEKMKARWKDQKYRDKILKARAEKKKKKEEEND